MLLAINLPHVGLSATPRAFAPMTIVNDVTPEVLPYIAPTKHDSWQPHFEGNSLTRHLFEEDHYFFERPEADDSTDEETKEVVIEALT